ncbi:MAG: lysine exporter LysO family protein [Bacteroidales bacterium]|jgi:uncharacterized membrane protein YbjE (DUF340 family)|nr:lysine exporter LysO family protein [Bacteroidales bacterium]
MLTIFLVIVSGMAVGYVARNIPATRYTGKIIGVLIALLLFSLGLSVGTNEQVIANFRFIGLDAFVIAAAATLGSVLCAAWVYRKFFRKKDKES